MILASAGEPCGGASDAVTGPDRRGLDDARPAARTHPQMPRGDWQTVRRERPPDVLLRGADHAGRHGRVLLAVFTSAELKTWTGQCMLLVAHAASSTKFALKCQQAGVDAVVAQDSSGRTAAGKR